MPRPSHPSAPVRTICYSPAVEVDAARRFYTEVLGFAVVMERPVVGLVSPANRSSQVLIPLAGFDHPQPAFGVDVGTPEAVDRTLAAALDRGLSVVHPLTDEEWGVRRFFVEDPNGTIINVLAHHPTAEEQS